MHIQDDALAREAGKPTVCSRRAFLNLAASVPLAAALSAVLGPIEQAEAASSSTLFKGRLLIKGPKLWKKLRRVSWSNTSGVTHIEFTHRSSNTVVLRCDGMYWPEWVHGKTTIKHESTKTYGVRWVIRCGDVKFYADVSNIPYQIWLDAHGEGWHSFTKSEAKTLLKLTTGGKIKYSKLVKWSRKKAIKKGNKAVKAWVGSKVISKTKVV